MERIKIYAIIIMTATIFFSNSAIAQTWSVGNGSSSNSYNEYPAPFGNDHWGARNQLVYRANELIMAGMTAGLIHQIGFYVTAQNGSGVHENFMLLMKNSSTTDLNVWETGMTTVVNPSPRTPVLGWNYLSFDSPFMWDGSSNIIVEVCFQNNSITNNASTQWTTGLSGIPSRWYSANAPGICGTGSSPDTGTVRPNARFIRFLTNDIGTLSINQPLLNSVMGIEEPFTPEATFVNSSATVQTNIPVCLKIYDASGAEVYSDHQVLSTLAYGATQQVPFASFTPASSGNFMVRAIALFPGDADRSNDTVSFSFTVDNPVWTIGLGTNYNIQSFPAPYGNYYWGARHQFVYRASELSAAGMTAGLIHRLGFNVIGLNNTGIYDNYTVSIKNSATTELTAWETGMTTVINASSRTPVLGWNLYTLNTPFAWDGSSNLVVEVCFQNTTTTLNASTQWTDVSGAASRWYCADTTGICGDSSVTGTGSYRQNIRFERISTQNDIQSFSIDEPLDSTHCMLGDTITPKATFRNVATTAQTNITVHLKIFDANGTQLYMDDKVINSLAFEEMQQVTFADFIPGFAGTYTVRAIVDNVGDQNVTNDTVSQVFPVSYPSWIIGTGTVSNGSTGYPAPYGNSHWGARHQFIYRANEMIEAGMTPGVIDQFGFNVTSLNGTGTYDDFTVLMKNSTTEDLNVWETGMTTVLNPAQRTPIVGWNMYAFDNPFIWDGISNIVVEVCFQDSSSTFNASTQWKQGVPGVSSRWYYLNAQGVCGSTESTASSTARPNARIMRNLPNDLAIQSVDNPVNNSFIVAGNTILPQATLINSSTVTKSNIAVRFKVTNASGVPVFVDNQIIDTLAKNTVRQISFPAFTLMEYGNYSYVAEVLNPDDMNHANDSIAGTFSISDPVWTIGAGTGYNNYMSYPAPYGNDYPGARHQFVYRASELLAAGMTPGEIHRFGFNVLALNSAGAHNNFTIKMKNSSTMDLNSWEGGTVTVLNGAPRVAVLGWNIYALDTPFVWDGSSNIIVEVCFQNAASTNNVSTQWTTGLSGVPTRFYRTYVQGVCGSTALTSTSTTRPNARFVRLISNDIAVNSIDNPASGSMKMIGTSFTPRASFKSFTNGILTNIQVRFKIFNSAGLLVYSDDQVIDTLTYNELQPVSFLNFNPSISGNYSACAIVLNPGDQNITNDSISISFKTIPSTWIIGTGVAMNGATAFPAPYGNSRWGARQQFVYRASELTAAGMTAGAIHQFGFNVTALNSSGTHEDFTILMKNSTSVNLNGWLTGMTTVINPASRTPVLGWNMYPLDTLFTWDGTSNIVVEVCFQDTNVTSNASTQWTTNLSGTPSRWYYENAQGVCGNPSFTNSGSSRPNAKFIRYISNDIAAISIDDPASGDIKQIGTTFSPKATFANYSTVTQNNIAIQLKILDESGSQVYYDNWTIDSLAAGATVQVSFTGFNPTSYAQYTAYAVVINPGDQFPGNDSVSVPFLVSVASWVIGNGANVNSSTTYPAPYGNSNWGARHQFVYRASELLAAGMTAGLINRFGFNVSSVNGAGTHEDYMVCMKNSSTTDLTGWESGMSVVLNPAPRIPVLGWNIYTLDAPFYWDGSSNIVVEVCFQNSSLTANASTGNTSLSGTVSRWYCANTQGICLNTSVTATGSTRPNARFDRILFNNDISVQSLSDPVSGIAKSYGISFIPKVTYKNEGATTQTNIPVRIEIFDGSGMQVYADDQVINVLDCGDIRQISFSGFTPASLGVFSVHAMVFNPGDQNTVNDSLSFAFTVDHSMWIIGTGTISNSSSGYPAPYGNLYWGARHQFVYRASELIASGMTAGTIHEFGFNVTGLNSAGTHNDFTIQMKNSTTTDLDSWESGMITVLNPASRTPVLGWNMYSLDTSFYWDGSSNIIVEVCFQNTSYLSNASTQVSSVSGIPSRWYYADSLGICGKDTIRGTGTSRPNARFGRITVPNDISVFSIDDPISNIGKEIGTIFTPTATFENIASSSQTNVPVRFKIFDASGVQVYTNDQVIDSVSLGAVKQVTFAGFTPLSFGDFTARAIVLNPGDMNHTNDSVSAPFTVSGIIWTVGAGAGTNGSTSYPTPYGNCSWGARHQFVYRASELTDAGMTAGCIHQLGFMVTDLNNSGTHENFTILAKNSAITDLTSWETGMTTVLSPAAQTPAVGWNYYVLDTPFMWDGSSNIVLETCFQNMFNTANASVQRTDNLTGIPSRWYHDNVPDICGSPASAITGTSRPNVRFVRNNTSNDIAAHSIDNPVSDEIKVVGITYSPKATFKNEGNITQINIPVSFKIFDENGAQVYMNNQMVNSLVTGASQQITFSGFTPSSMGNYTARIVVANPGDLNNINDSIFMSFSVSNENWIIGSEANSNSPMNYPAPYGNYYWGARHQFVYRASELVAAGMTAGMIDQFGFKVTALNGCGVHNNFTILMKNSIITDLDFWEPGMATVLDPAPRTPVLGWNVYMLDTPFNWDGNSNIIVEVCFQNNLFTRNASTESTNISGMPSRWYHTDAMGVCGNSAETSIGTSRPNARFLRHTAPDDISTLSVDDPVSNIVKVIGNPFTPRATYRNCGTTMQTNIPVLLKIFDANGVQVFTDQQVIGSLASGASQQISFADFAPLSVGYYTALAMVQDSGDQNHSNDTTTLTFMAYYSSWTIGSGTVTNNVWSYPAPYGNYNQGARHQFVYRSSELLAAGMTAGEIQQFGFNVMAVNNSGTHDNFTIMMKNSATIDLNSWETGMTTVMNPSPRTPVLGWNIYTLDQPFIWDGTSNIVVEVCFQNSSSTENAFTQLTTDLPGVPSRWNYDNSQGVCGNNSLVAVGTGRPNALFVRFLNQNDLVTHSVDDPASGTLKMIGETFTPRVTFRNFGTLQQTSIPVRFKIFDHSGTQVYINNQLISSLAFGVLQQVAFSSFTPSILGNYTARAIILNPGDQDHSNDSITIPFTVSDNSVPVITSIIPDQAVVGDTGFTITVNGSNFLTPSIVRWNSSDRATTYISDNQVTALISAADIASADTAAITVFNPPPGGGLSNAVIFIIGMNAISEYFPKKDDFILYQNYPNPFNQNTYIVYTMQESAHVSIKIYDLFGREVTTLVNEWKEAGSHTVSWEAPYMRSGIYFCHLQVGNVSIIKKMVLM